MTVGGKDKWPDAFYWENFVLKECPKDTITAGIAAAKFTDPCFVKAGDDLKTLLDAKPFNTGFLATPAQQGAGSSAAWSPTARQRWSCRATGRFRPLSACFRPPSSQRSKARWAFSHSPRLPVATASRCRPWWRRRLLVLDQGA